MASKSAKVQAEHVTLQAHSQRKVPVVGDANHLAGLRMQVDRIVALGAPVARQTMMLSVNFSRLGRRAKQSGNTVRNCRDSNLQYLINGDVRHAGNQRDSGRIQLSWPLCQPGKEAMILSCKGEIGAGKRYND